MFRAYFLLVLVARIASLHAFGETQATCHKDGDCSDTSALPSVTVIIPTCYHRHRFHENVLKAFKHQTYEGDMRLLVHDGACGKSDSSKSEISSIFDEASKADDGGARVEYHHDPTTSEKPGENGVMSLGAKRNWLLDRVETDLVAHFDDDDYYGPDYLKEMIRRMRENEADLVKLDGWFMYGEDYSNGEKRDAFVYYDFSDGNKLGWGWTLMYKRNLWEEFKYADKMFMEEDGFVNDISRKGYKVHTFGDHDFLALKIVTNSFVRATGMPLCVSQRSGARSCYRYDLPRFMLFKGFGDRIKPWLQMWDKK